jgi:hypothetical protein
MTAAIEDRAWAADISWMLIAPLPQPPTDRRLLPLTGTSPRRTAPTILCELIWCPGGWPWVFQDADAWSETECWQTAVTHYGWAEDWIGRRACPACRQHPEFRPAPATCLPVPYKAPPGRHKRQMTVPVTVTPPLPPLPEVVADDTDVITATDLPGFDFDTPPGDTPLPNRRWSLPWSKP